MIKTNNYKKIIILHIVGFLVGLGACSKSPQPAIIQSNETECIEFLSEQQPNGILYYTGQSDWKSDLNATRLLAFQTAQTQLASAVESKVTNVCVERSTYTATSENSRQKMEQRCQTIVQTQNLDVSPLSKNASYCTEMKSYVQAKKKKMVYRTTGRIVVSEKEFDQYLTLKAKENVTDN